MRLLIALQIVFAIMSRLEKLSKLHIFSQESLQISLANRQLHAKQIVNESENFQEHGESMFTHESNFHWHIKERLSQLIVSDRKSTTTCEDISRDFVLVRENKLSS